MARTNGVDPFREEHTSLVALEKILLLPMDLIDCDG
jgi:hypothetical protein